MAQYVQHVSEEEAFTPAAAASDPRFAHVPRTHEEKTRKRRRRDPDYNPDDDSENEDNDDKDEGRGRKRQRTNDDVEIEEEEDEGDEDEGDWRAGLNEFKQKIAEGSASRRRRELRPGHKMDLDSDDEAKEVSEKEAREEKAPLRTVAFDDDAWLWERKKPDAGVIAATAEEEVARLRKELDEDDKKFKVD